MKFKGRLKFLIVWCLVLSNAPVASEIASASGISGTITVGDAPCCVVVDSERTFAYVSNTWAQTLSKIDLNSGLVIATLSVGVENDAIVLHQVRKALRLPTESEIDAVAGCLKVGGPMPSRTDEDAAIAALFRKEWGR